jgi:hypothetical protein
MKEYKASTLTKAYIDLKKHKITYREPKAIQYVILNTLYREN